MKTTIAAWKHLPPEMREEKVNELASRVDDLPQDLMMTREQLRSMAASPYVTIGGHTRTHPILAAISDADASAEIEGGKSDLENCIQQELALLPTPTEGQASITNRCMQQ